MFVARVRSAYLVVLGRFSIVWVSIQSQPWLENAHATDVWGGKPSFDFVRALFLIGLSVC